MLVTSKSIMKFIAVEAIFLITVLPLSSSGMKLWTAFYSHCSCPVITTIICVRLVLVQVLNFNTTCIQNKVLYECITNGFLSWTIRQSSSTTNLFTYGYTTSSGTANYTKGIAPSTISAQLIFRNSTFISSVLTITNVTS